MSLVCKIHGMDNFVRIEIMLPFTCSMYAPSATPQCKTVPSQGDIKQLFGSMVLASGFSGREKNDAKLLKQTAIIH